MTRSAQLDMFFVAIHKFRRHTILGARAGRTPEPSKKPDPVKALPVGPVPRVAQEEAGA